MERRTGINKPSAYTKRRRRKLLAVLLKVSPYLTSVPIAQTTHCISITVPKNLTVFREKKSLFVLRVARSILIIFLDKRPNTV